MTKNGCILLWESPPPVLAIETLMPVVADEESEYGYLGENRHMVHSFLAGSRPAENFADGLNVTELLMAA